MNGNYIACGQCIVSIVNSLMINLISIPGGSTRDIGHIPQYVICQTYFALNDDSVRKTMFRKIEFTMSDRADVNHAVHNELHEV